LGKGALDFKYEAVREHIFRLIEEAVRRYDCDGLELDFQRFPTFFQDGTTQERVAKINSLVQRVRKMLDAEGKKRSRRLVLAARIPSDYGRSAPSYDTARSIGCDPVAWGKDAFEPPFEVLNDIGDPDTIRPPFRVESGVRQLFLDDRLIVSSKGLRRVWHSAEKFTGNPVLRREKPWEGSGPYVYGTVLF